LVLDENMALVLSSQVMVEYEDEEIVHQVD
jgi:hypothetical protein